MVAGKQNQKIKKNQRKLLFPLKLRQVHRYFPVRDGSLFANAKNTIDEQEVKNFLDILTRSKYIKNKRVNTGLKAENNTQIVRYCFFCGHNYLDTASLTT